MLASQRNRELVKERSSDVSGNMDDMSDKHGKRLPSGSLCEWSEKDFLTREDHVTLQPNIFL